MKTFEYMVRTLGNNEGPPRPGRKAADWSTIQDELNLLGSEGWDLVEIVSSDRGPSVRFAIMKRELGA